MNSAPVEVCVSDQISLNAHGVKLNFDYWTSTIAKSAAYMNESSCAQALKCSSFKDV